MCLWDSQRTGAAPAGVRTLPTLLSEVGINPVPREFEGTKAQLLLSEYAHENMPARISIQGAEHGKVRRDLLRLAQKGDWHGFNQGIFAARQAGQLKEPLHKSFSAESSGKFSRQELGFRSVPRRQKRVVQRFPNGEGCVRTTPRSPYEAGRKPVSAH